MRKAFLMAMVNTTYNFWDNILDIRLNNLLLSQDEILSQIMFHEGQYDKNEMSALKYVDELYHIFMAKLLQNVCLISSLLYFFWF